MTVFFILKNIILIVFAILLISIITIFQFSVFNAYHKESFPNSWMDPCYKPAPWTTTKRLESTFALSTKSSMLHETSDSLCLLLQSIPRTFIEGDHPGIIACLSWDDTMTRFSSFIFPSSFLQVIAAPPSQQKAHFLIFCS